MNKNSIKNNLSTKLEELKKFLGNNIELIFVSFISGILVMLIGITATNIYAEQNQLENINSYKNKLERDQIYWNNLTRNYPDYKDAYMQYALVSYQLGELDNVKIALNKALKIDPDYIEARELLEKL